MAVPDPEIINQIRLAKLAQLFGNKSPYDIVPPHTKPNPGDFEMLCADLTYAWVQTSTPPPLEVFLLSGLKAAFAITIRWIQGDGFKIENDGFKDRNDVLMGFARDFYKGGELVIPPDDLTPWRIPTSGGLQGTPIVSGDCSVAVTIYGMKEIPPL